MPADAAFLLAGQTLWLMPERCAYWQDGKILLLADLHLGKAAHLRHHGLSVPEGHTANDLSRLTFAIQRTGAREVYFCGDLFHSSAAQSPAILELFQKWRASHPDVNFTLITGNHDLGKALPPPACGMHLAGASLHRAPFHFIHDPADATGAPGTTISGHLHPLAALTGTPVRTAKAPCFWYQSRSRIFVLPAFSSFTAGVAIRPHADDTIHAIHGEQVTHIPTQLCRGPVGIPPFNR